MILLAPEALQQIVEAAQAAYPEECCGLLVGVCDSRGERTVRRAVASRNVAGEYAAGGAPEDSSVGETGGEGLRDLLRRRFEVDPLLRLRLMRELEGSGESIVGHYHSHPDHPAQPSSHDLECVWEPELVWLITSVVKGKAVSTTAYLADAEGRAFHEVEWRTSGGD